MALPLALLLAMGSSISDAQQLPAGPAPVPTIRRGADGQLEVVKPEAPPAVNAPAQPVSPTPRIQPNVDAPRSAEPIVKAPQPKVATPASPDVPSSRAGTAPVTPAATPPADRAMQPHPSGATTVPSPVASPAQTLKTMPAGTAPPVSPEPVNQEPALVLLATPSPFAIELPQDGQTEIAADAPSLKRLFSSVRAGALEVTHETPSVLKLGVTLVAFTAWQGRPQASQVAVRRSIPLLVLPHGQVPVGSSWDERATASNNSAKALRDEAGFVHLIWLDAGGDRTPRVMYLRGITDDATGAMTWDHVSGATGDRQTSEPEPLSLSAGVATPWNAYTGMAAAPGGVMAVWQGSDGILMRRIQSRAGPDGLEIGEIIKTPIPSDGREMGPSIIVSSENDIALLSPLGELALSADGGSTWNTEKVPIPTGEQIKNIAMAKDSHANIHVVFIGMQNDRYWELRYVRRMADGQWVDAHNVLADIPAWQKPAGEEQALADFPAILIDRKDGIHVAWHGTGNSRKYGQDEDFYRYRPLTEAGSWAEWGEVQSIWPADAAHTQASFAPSLSVDRPTDSVIAVVFSYTHQQRWEAGARLLRHGVIAGDRLHFSGSASEQITLPTGIWFPSAAPVVFHSPAGRTWLDTIETATMPSDLKAPNVVVYRATDVGGWIERAGGGGAQLLSIAGAASSPMKWILGGVGSLLIVTIGLGLVTASTRPK